jgi:hypothetical protein
VILLGYGKFNNNEQQSVELDNTLYCPVSVICTFNHLGEIRPDYVQFINQEESKETFKIQGIKSHKPIPYAIQYVCYINICNIQKQIKLTYFYQKCIWAIEK